MSHWWDRGDSWSGGGWWRGGWWDSGWSWGGWWAEGSEVNPRSHGEGQWQQQQEEEEEEEEQLPWLESVQREQFGGWLPKRPRTLGGFSMLQGGHAGVPLSAAHKIVVLPRNSPPPPPTARGVT